MTSDRPYRCALGWAAARKEIHDWRGRQFDPDVVDAFGALEDELHHVLRELTAA
jgi:HD-GYP domain-containing protein (c-di-GMP phosphodiesterase class II)